MKAVEYLDDTFKEVHGYITPGWYFWEETWADCQGPFKSEKETNEKLKIYCETFLS